MNDPRDFRQADLFEAQDQGAREHALDIGRSFLVQAPAGSGKTELLVQRCLALLATVDEPERIVALTFTRKAAGEMRERVLKALLEAKKDAPVDSPHDRRTRALAEDALRQDARRGWNLIEHASRLRLLTFDALVVGLARRAPLAAGLGPHPVYIDDARSLHRAAAKAALAAAPADAPHWRNLLVHLDNNAVRAVSLIADLLQRRAEWLRLVAGQDPDAMRAAMECALRTEVEEVLKAARNAFPDVGPAIAEFARQSAAVLAHGDGDAARAAALLELAARGGLPPPTAAALSQWQTLRRFLLTDDGLFRLRFDASNGFLRKGKGRGADEREARKNAMLALCNRLRAVPGLERALAEVRGLPPPQISDASWRIVVALLHVLVEGVQALDRVFRESGKVDFAQGNLAAMQALGTEDAPSDLLLRIDARIDHLLVDEFQDTSLAQLDLLTRLTEGWQPGDGRTLFAVGDPMQSIYRFREAEVRLFVDAQNQRRIASVPVEPLYLRCNFRSQRGLVDWVNANFPQVLGNVSDAARGAVAFAPATAACDPCGDLAPTLDLATSVQEEAATVVARIQESRADDVSRIAVLVRARSHLVALLPVLRRAGIPFAAVELDQLSDRQAVRDLVALTHALLQPADRTAWLAVLRAPWCGLVLRDLSTVADAVARSRHGVPSLLEDAASVEGLSVDGRERLSRVAAVLGPALAARGRASVVARVRGAWLALGGPACLDEALDLTTTESYFALLAEHERGGDVADWEAFLVALAELLASPATPGAAGVQVMTMHKAKGLEFDTVILAGLGAQGSGDDAPLLRWRRRAGLLIAPGKRRGGANDPVYDYLGQLDKDENSAELGRLLYVACTRARTRLHLIAAPPIRKVEDGSREWKPHPSSSLAKLWPAVGGDQPRPPQLEDGSRADAIEPRPLLRLRRGSALPAPRPALDVVSVSARPDVIAPPFEWATEAARRIGTLAHRWLARIAMDGPTHWTDQHIGSLEPRVRASLRSAGFADAELPGACARVLDAIRRTLADPRGRWLFDPGHEDARSEWAIAGVDGGEIVHVILDRTFIAGGERWIVDYKTGVHEGGELAAFLDREVERYRGQLLRYARLARALDARPVRLALYYPLVDGGFREIPVDQPL